jgi:Zn-dependent membrane protease YugP
MFFDYYYLVLVIPAVLLSLWAQVLVKSTFARYSRINCRRHISGREAAELLLRANRINGVRVEAVGGALTDHYDPRTRVLRLSQPVYGKTSIAAVGVAAHETGHAIQHEQSWAPLALRSALAPVANIGSSFGPWLAMAGLIFAVNPLINAGIILFGGAVLFYLITLPVEFNASGRALALLKRGNILSPEELRGARKVLRAAALTYVASALTALMSFLRLILLSRGRRR